MKCTGGCGGATGWQWGGRPVLKGTKVLALGSSCTRGLHWKTEGVLSKELLWGSEAIGEVKATGVLLL